MKESKNQKQALIDASREGFTLFRNNVGTGWQGKVERRQGFLLIENPRPLHAGLCKGSSDTIGWMPITITPEMVGRKVAVFTAYEFKATNRSTVRKEQANFINTVKSVGGIAGIATNIMDIKNILLEYMKNAR